MIELTGPTETNSADLHNRLSAIASFAGVSSYGNGRPVSVWLQDNAPADDITNAQAILDAYTRELHSTYSLPPITRPMTTPAANPSSPVKGLSTDTGE